MYWYEKQGNNQDIFVSTRVRFARNLVDYPFDAVLGETGANEIIEKVQKVLTPCNFENADISKERLPLAEKHIISYDMAKKETPSALFIRDNTYIMVCEEDHLRIQAIYPGLDFENAYKSASEAEAVLDSELSFAFDEKLGYLTHCPTNLGTAMRAGVMMFLPALTMTGRMKGLENQLSKLGLTIRGADGEGSGSKGCLYQISNCITLGITEEETIENLRSAAESIASAEREMREALMKSKGDALRDKIMRSIGTLKYAYMLSSDELYSLYADIRLGASLGLTDKKEYEIDTMLFTNLPYQTAAKLGSNNSVAERDKERAKTVRAMI